jgi:hypothetical protein
MTTNSILNKLLVDQATEQVIWIAPGPNSVLPMLDSNLNYRIYFGLISTDLYQEYNRFRLFYDVAARSLTVMDGPPTVDKEKLVLLRYRCQVFHILNSTFNVFIERMNLPNSKYIESINDITRNSWITVYQETFSCSKEEASKLLDFKITEYQKSTFMIESARFKMISEITKAKSVDELKFIYDTNNIKVFNVNSIKLF